MDNESLTSLGLTDEQARGVMNLMRNSQAQTSASSLSLEHIRTVHTVLKPQKPESYKGAIDALGCLNFIESVEEYYECVTLAKELWVQCTVLAITDDAKAWWRDVNMTTETPWAEFREAFIDAFTPPNSSNDARLALSKLKQSKTMSVAEYTAQFRRLKRLIRGLELETTLYYYTEGLESDTSKEVLLRQPKTLEEAISAATIVHSILHRKPPTVVPRPMEKPSTALPPAEPMDLDAMQTLMANLATNINALTKQRLGPLTSQERAYLKSINGCYRCRQPGHISTNCHANLPGTNSNNRRRFNHLDTSEDDIKDTKTIPWLGKDKGEH